MPRAHVGERAGEWVPAAEVGPDLGVLRHVGTNRLVRRADQVVEQSARLDRQPEPAHPRPVGERHDGETVVGGQEDLRGEGRHHALVLEHSMSPCVATEERQALARDPGVRLVLGLEHRGQRRGLEHGAVLIAATTEERREVAGHVPGRRVGAAPGRRHHLVVGVRLGATGAQVVAGGQPRPGRLRWHEVGVDHAEGGEDVLAQVAVERLPDHVRDELAQRGEPVIGVPPPRPRLGDDAQAGPVVPGRRRQRSSDSHGLAEQFPAHAGGMQHLADPSGVSEQVTHRGGPPRRIRRQKSEGAQVVVRRRVQVDQRLLHQLHHGDRGEGLGE
jgi:hypothetical protein